MNSTGAIVVAPFVGLLIISPLLFISDFIFLISAWVMLFVAIIMTAVFGLPVHGLLKEKTKATYWHYGLVGLVFGATIGSIAGFIGSVLGGIWGVSTLIVFRLLVSKEVQKSKKHRTNT